MDKQRKRKLDARARRQASLHPELVNEKIELEKKKPETKVAKVEVRPTKVKSDEEQKKVKTGTSQKKIVKDVVTKKKHNSKGRK
ncbi:MAG: hypothetical protein ABFD50_20615 [Smithella sp.]